jgi:hypothetical protein
MSRGDRLSWTIARLVADMPAGTVFTATSSATLGVRLSQELLGCRLCLCGRGGAYDLSGILSLHARHWLFNRRPHAHVSLPQVFDTQSEPHALLATPAQVDGAARANLSGIGDPAKPKVAFGGTRGLPDARAVHFVLPAHSPRQLVDRVDFASTCAATRDAPSLLVTELCVMRWSASANVWVLEEIAPEIDIEDLRARTGFTFKAAARLRPFEEMPQAARALLPELDPLRLRDLDFVTDRKMLLDAFERIYSAEADLVGHGHMPRPTALRARFMEQDNG